MLRFALVYFLYFSFDYEDAGYETSDLVKVNIIYSSMKEFHYEYKVNTIYSSMKEFHYEYKVNTIYSSMKEFHYEYKVNTI